MKFEKVKAGTGNVIEAYQHFDKGAYTVTVTEQGDIWIEILNSGFVISTTYLRGIDLPGLVKVLAEGNSIIEQQKL